jgi:hypothetical protein
LSGFVVPQQTWLYAGKSEHPVVRDHIDRVKIHPVRTISREDRWCDPLRDYTPGIAQAMMI